MTAKQKAGATRAKVGRKKARATMNQLVPAARRKTKSLGRDTEPSAANVSAAMRPPPVLTAMLATAMAWQAAGLRAGATLTKRWLTVSGLAFYQPQRWWRDAERVRVGRQSPAENA